LASHVLRVAPRKSLNLTPSAPISRPRMAHVFFGIYFFMTGLHGFHVLIGIGIWVWMLLKAMKGQFGPTYFGPIDFTALYWHLVDLIWIYLFPLLYLIH
jgi:cytochrome c oxidase subunit 3